jgi:ketosteroid isomerase-like protein
MTAHQPEASLALDNRAIRNLIARIAQLADTGGADEYTQCFMPDARWDMPGAPRRGRADIHRGSQARRDAGEIGPGTDTWHSVDTVVVDVEGDTAHARSHFQFFDQMTTTPRLRLVGLYDDRFVRTRDGWLLDHRRITLG